jgi:oligogalacturonide transport system permease protein
MQTEVNIKVSKFKGEKDSLLTKLLSYLFLCAFGLVMIYPLLWLFSSSFKPNSDIFKSLSLIPEKIVLDSYINGWKGTGQYTFGTFFINTFKVVIPTVFFTVVSSTIVAYGFAKFDFPLKKILFSLMISTLMLPHSVIMIPRYIIFNKFGWLDSYLPFYIPVLFACTPFFIFMMIQFLRGLPKELEESAYIDGCNSFQTLISIILPLCKPPIISMIIFQFIWTWNDFLNTLIYVNSVNKFTIALGLRMSIDAAAAVNWNQIMAMTTIAMMPCVIIFFAAQKHFVEGIATTGLKG